MSGDKVIHLVHDQTIEENPSFVSCPECDCIAWHIWSNGEAQCTVCGCVPSLVVIDEYLQ